MLSAFDALSALEQQPTVNIKIFLEGEEEAGNQVPATLHEGREPKAVFR